MLAYQLVEWQQAPVLRDVPVPEPGPGEVLVKIGGAEACHSDLHVVEWPAGSLPYELPFTLGHENAGWVAAVGDGVRGVEVGEPVAVYGPRGCGRCARCVKGLENYCARPSEAVASPPGIGADGGMAPLMVVPHPRYLVPLGDLDIEGPREMLEVLGPRHTPSGRPIPRLRLKAREPSEIMLAIAVGRIVQPVTATFAETHRHPDVVFVPFSDLPMGRTVLAWRRRDRDPGLRAFLRVLREQQGQRRS